MQIENYNEPYLNALSEYDDGRDLTSYDFEADCFSSPYDDVNKKKLAYRHRAIGEKYAKVSQQLLYLALFPLKVLLHKVIQPGICFWLYGVHVIAFLFDMQRYMTIIQWLWMYLRLNLLNMVG